MTTCLNCGVDLTGRFCAHCGQRNVPPRPTLRELMGDAYGELVGWDGKLARTIVLLVRSPGALARAIIDGHRVSYISPVRLYLACSLRYFLVSAAVPDPNVERSFDVGVGVDPRASAQPSPGWLAAAGRRDDAARAVCARAGARRCAGAVLSRPSLSRAPLLRGAVPVVRVPRPGARERDGVHRHARGAGRRDRPSRRW